LIGEHEVSFQLESGLPIPAMAVAGFSTVGQLLTVRFQEDSRIHPKRVHINFKRKPLGALRFYNGEKTRGVLRIRADASTDREQKLREQQHEIRVCINKACRKSGSLETLDVMRSLAPPNVKVESCGCIGMFFNPEPILLRICI